MGISISDVEGVLQARSLLNPSLDVLNPNDQSYRALLLQPTGPILADNTRIGPLDLAFADTQATKFLELAKAKGHHLVVTPEYYLPIETPLRVRIVVASIESSQWAATKDGNGKVLREVQR